MDLQTPAPTPPVHAARLSALLKSLANAEGAVSESIKARRDLIRELEKILELNRTALSSEELKQQDLISKKTAVEAKKRDVEDGIMRGLSADTSNSAPHGSPDAESHTTGQHEPSAEPERPQMEELTPPPMESLTPMDSPRLTAEAAITTTTGADIVREQQPDHTEPAPMYPPAPMPVASQAGSDLLSSLSMPPARLYAQSHINGGAKKRKMQSTFDEFVGGDAMEGLDEDVAELLRAESGGQ